MHSQTPEHQDVNQQALQKAQPEAEQSSGRESAKTLPGSILQRKTQAMANSSPQVLNLVRMQNLAQQSVQMGKIAQLQAKANLYAASAPSLKSINLPSLNPVVQRAKLGTGNLESAKKYITWYFSGGDPKKTKGDALREIYTQIGIDNDSAGDRQTKAKLKTDGVIDDQDVTDLENNVEAYLGGGKAALPQERKNISAETWIHIWRGDFNAGKNKATGYHWTGKGNASWLEKTGNTGNSHAGFYEEEVKVRDDKVDAINTATGAQKGKIRGKVKDDMSTFFPNGWSDSEVKDAIETRDSQGQITSKVAAGITLVKSGATIYPSID